MKNKFLQLLGVAFLATAATANASESGTEIGANVGAKSVTQVILDGTAPSYGCGYPYRGGRYGYPYRRRGYGYGYRRY